MKNYVKPSLEVSKFDIEDIITVSGKLGDAVTSDAAKAVYNDYYITGDSKAQADDGVVEFMW